MGNGSGYHVVKIIEREGNAGRGDIEDLGRNKSKMKITMECHNGHCP